MRNLAAITLLSLALIGCDDSQAPIANPLYTVDSKSRTIVQKYIDPETGVRYLIAYRASSGTSSDPGGGITIIRADLPTQTLEK